MIGIQFTMPRMLFDFYLLFYILPLEVSSLEMIPFNTTHFRLSWDEAILRNGVTPRCIIIFEKTEERDVEIGMVKFNGSYSIDNNVEEMDLCKRHTFMMTLKYEDGEDEKKNYEYSSPDFNKALRMY